MQRRRGFTLIEILTVMFIFGVLVSISGYVYSAALARSRDNQRKTDLQTVKNSLEQFYLDNRAYPGFDDNVGGIVPAASWQLEKNLNSPCAQASNKKFLTPAYVANVPEDPQKKLALTNNCTFSPTGEYLYYSLLKPTASPPVSREGYYLIAKMERENNFSDPTLLSAVSSRLNTTENYSSVPTISADLGTYNHVVSSSRNN